jgi:hypothetical protein
VSDETPTADGDIGVDELLDGTDSADVHDLDSAGATSQAPSRRGVLRLVLAVAGILVLVLLGGYWITRSTPEAAPAASPGAGATATSKIFQTGAAYVPTTAAASGDALPRCAASAATWRAGADGSVVTTVAVAGPKLVAIVVVDKAHPERPNTSHGSVLVKAGQKSGKVAVPAPVGGIGRVQVGIQGDQGIQQCTAAQSG